MSEPPRRKSVDETGEFIADAREYFFLSLFQAMRRRDAAFELALKPSGLTLTTWRAILIIYRLQPCTMNDLARISTVERTTLTRTVDGLVEQGLVDRSTPAEDRRQVRLCLTASGQAAYGAAMDILVASNTQALDGISEERLREMIRDLNHIVANLIGDPELVADVLSLSAAGVEPRPFDPA